VLNPFQIWFKPEIFHLIGFKCEKSLFIDLMSKGIYYLILFFKLTYGYFYD